MVMRAVVTKRETSQMRMMILMMTMTTMMTMMIMMTTFQTSETTTKHWVQAEAASRTMEMDRDEAALRERDVVDVLPLMTEMKKTTKQRRAATQLKPVMVSTET